MGVLSVLSCPAKAISEAQKTALVDHCASIKEDLRSLQKADARTRVYLGSYLETALSKFIVPLNLRLVENNLSSADFIENQNDFVAKKSAFINDFISYQQHLEELVAMNCGREPEKFYEKLVKVRDKRAIVERDVLALRTLLSEHVKLVLALGSKL